MIKRETVKTILPFLVLAIAILFINTQLLMISYIPTPSMEPTLRVGEYVINTRVFKNIEREDIVVFEKYGTILVKRIIGLPGDTLEIKNNKVYVNGTYLDCKYINESMETEDIMVEIPENEYFVMGDNRNHSYDSRKFGTIQKDAIIAKKL